MSVIAPLLGCKQTRLRTSQDRRFDPKQPYSLEVRRELSCGTAPVGKRVGDIARPCEIVRDDIQIHVSPLVKTSDCPPERRLVTCGGLGLRLNVGPEVHHRWRE